MAFMDVLPDPNRKILDSGKENDSTGTAGPGFASIKVSSNRSTMLDKTNSGRAVARSVAGHSWNVDVRYNPLTRDEFEPIYSFLLSRLGKLNPFFIELPNHVSSRDSTFTTFAAANTISVQTDTTTASAGQTYILIDAGSAFTANPKPGDMFTITDSSNANHVKVYRITRVETNTDYDTSIADQPASTSEKRIHFTPPLAYSVSDNSTLDFSYPRMRVRLAGDVQEYSLGTNNLYQFSLKLEEALP